MKLCVTSLIASLSLLAPSANATTWVVDDTPGPGVDFPNLFVATAIALPGDVFIVRAGTYGGFTLSTAAVVLGESGVFVTGDIRISNNEPFGHAALVNLTAQSIYVDPSTGGVLLQDLVARPGTIGGTQTGLVQIQDCADVRVHNVDVDLIDRGIAALAIASSRVEVAGGRFVGGRGRSHHIINNPVPPEDGGAGILVSGTSDLHASRVDACGGIGGDLPAAYSCSCLVAANGGAGIRIGTGSKLLLTGTSLSLVKGGKAGIGDTCASDGHPGNGIVVHPSGSARISGSTVAGEAPRAFCGGSSVLPIIGPYNVPAPAEPTLKVAGSLTPGSLATYTLTGQPGATGRLFFGRIMSITDVPFVAEDRLTLDIRSFNMGVIPPSGEVSFTIQISNHLPSGFLVNAQGETHSESVGISLSPSAPVTVR